MYALNSNYKQTQQKKIQSGQATKFTGAALYGTFDHTAVGQVVLVGGGIGSCYQAADPNILKENFNFYNVSHVNNRITTDAD